MHYVDGFVAAVPTENKEKYIKHAQDAVAVFKDHGALSVVECWGDDVNPMPFDGNRLIFGGFQMIVDQ